MKRRDGAAKEGKRTEGVRVKERERERERVEGALPIRSVEKGDRGSDGVVA